MPDIIITPSSGKLEFVDLSAQVTRRHSFTLNPTDGLSLDSPLSAAAISAPLNVINVTVDNTNNNYPFVLASGSVGTGTKTLMMDGAGGTYNPFTNTATIDISGNAATATNSTQLNGQAASYYTNIPARLGYTPVNQAGDTITGNVVINGNFTVTGATTLFSASSVYISSSQLVVDDNIITLNAFSPFLRYTGIEMIDSGSATTSSILWDSQNDYFFLTGSGINGKIITGPDQQGNLTSTKIPKATGTNILGDSIITDNGSSISIGGSITATNLSGTNTGDQTVGDATLTLAAGTGIGLSATPTFTANATTNKTITVTNNGVTSAIAGTGISVDTGTGAVTITNSSPNATHTGDVTGATSLTIAANAVTTAKILDANVTNAKLANSSVTIGSTAVSLGATVTTFAGLTSVTSTNFVGALTGTATTASYANALNPANNYTVNSLTEGGYLAYPLREYVINFTAQSTASFYPIAIDSPPGTDGTWHHSFSIDEVNQGGAAAYNVHSMYGEVRGQGWTDQPYFHRVFHNFYDSAERSLLGVWRPTTSWYGVVVYVRGGKNYYVRTTSRSVNGYSSATNVGGTVTYAIKNAAGADVSGTSANIAEMLNLINNPSGFYHSDNAYIGTNQAIHLGTTSAPNLSIGGTAANATILQTARNIGGVSFNGSADINLPGVNTAGNQNTSGNAATATTASYANNINPANSYSAATVTTTGKLEAGGNVIAGGQFSGAGTGLTGTAASLTAGTATSANALNASNNYQVNSIGVNIAGSGTAGRIGTNENGVRSWTITPTGGKLVFDSGDGLGSANFTYPVSASVFSGAGTGLTGTAANLTVGTALNVGNGTLTISTGTGIGIGATTTFTANQSGNSTITLSNTGVTAITTNTGLSTNASATGAVTITNTGVTSVAGTTNQVSVSAGTGAVTFSLPQNIHTAATPTFASITTSADGANITMAGTTNAEGIRMTASSSATYPVFLRSLNPGSGGESSPWIYKEAAADWGIWHNNPVNSIDFTKQGSGGIASNVGGSSTNTVTVRVEMATGYVQTIAGYRNSAGTTILSDTGNITGNAATATTATTANALNTSNSYTGVNFTATGYFQTNLGQIKSDTLFALLTTSNGAQGVSARGLLLGTSYDTTPGANEIRTTNNTSLFLNARGTGDIQFQTADSLKMMLLNNGNVGIGTSNPTAKVESYFSSNAITFNYLATNLNNSSPIPVYSFDVTNGVGETRSIKAGIGYERHLTNGRGTMHFYNASTNDTQSLTGSRTTAGDIKMSLDNSGNLGIGTTIPTQLLDVRGNIKLGADNSGNYIYYVKDTEGTIIRTARSDASQVGLFRSDGWGNFTVDKSIGIGYSLGTGFASSTVGNGNLYVAGNVGIGTTSFTYASSNRGNIEVYGSTDALIGLRNATANFYLQKTGNDCYFSNGGAGAIYFYTNNTQVITVASNGNVGIGTSVPGQKLDVEGRIRTRGATGTGGFEIGAATTGAARWRIEWDSASDSLDFNWVG